MAKGSVAWAMGGLAQLMRDFPHHIAPVTVHTHELTGTGKRRSDCS